MPYYKSGRTILERHGLITWAFYWITNGISYITISHHLRALPEKPPFQFARDPQWKKPLPWWQDLATLLPTLLLSVTAITAGWFQGSVAAWVAMVSAAWGIVDSLNYLLRVLWFDDITPRFAETRRAVWSHRRILFIALLAYAQSILLFPIFYHRMAEHSGDAYWSLLEKSFLTATLIEATEPVRFATVSQVLVSLFLLTVAIAVIAAISYKREELADNNW